MPNKKKQGINDRKLDHINIVLGKEVEPFSYSSFDGYRLPYKALPEVSLDSIDTSTEFLGSNLRFPFVISSMTGGPDKGKTINRNLAEAAEEAGVALGLGSMRVVLRKPESIPSFDVKRYCPSVPLLANLGLVQLNYGLGADEINRIVDSINADGIFLHINPLQEAVQPEGDTNFEKLLPKLEKVLPKMKKPVVIKEVGTGIDKDSAQMLADVGIRWIDVSGTGGTSWSWVEGYRRDDDLGKVFRHEGIPTCEAIMQAKEIKGVNLIAGGGIRNGIHIAKAIVMGAKLATSAKPLLDPALSSSEAVLNELNKLRHELMIAMFITGSKNLKDLSKLKLKYQHHCQ
ncbi:MAG: type 2 isopentenyl-diphosphate Delta-isomerase [Candidatus Dojkabacteria bacterium]